MADKELPSWAMRLREERTKRLWSQKVTAVRLRNAADEETRAVLPSVENIQRYVRGYEAGKHFPGELYAELYCRAFGLTHDQLFGTPMTVEPDRLPTKHDAHSLIDWITATNVSDDAISNIEQATLILAEKHTQRPPTELLTDVTRLHKQIQDLLHAGKQRFSQTRDLYRIDADLLAHGSLLLGDLHFDVSASAYGSAALLCAKEVGANPAIAFSVQAKTERWRFRFAEAADLARHGFDCSPPTTIRILLASQEAHAAALLGDARRARQALNRAEYAAVGPITPDSGVSAWSCSPPRQALFALAVAIRTGAPDAALRAADMADSAWSSGTPRVAATWAQVRLAAGIAHIMKNDLDSVTKELTPVLSLAPEYRMATITGYTAQIGQRLRQRRFQGNAIAMSIREQIYEFNAAALPTLTASEDD
jgi:transcriptional regulator with XRE-family HTH domain